MKYEQSQEDLKQTKLENETLLKDFKGEQVHISGECLEKALEDKFVALQKAKKHNLAKVAIGIGILLLASTFTIPQVQVFAKEAIESIFKDRGIENAVVAGYPEIPEVEGAIGDYKVRLFNIYMDEMRLSFEAEVIGLPEKEEDQKQDIWYELYIDSDNWKVNGQNVDEVGISSSSFTRGETTSIQVQGEGVKKLVEQEQVQVPVKLLSSAYDSQSKNGRTLLGKATLTLTIPSELHQEAKVYILNEHITLEDGNIYLEELEVNPTMMALKYSSHIEEGYITGLANLKLTTKNSNYAERTTMGLSYDEKGGVTEYIIPSIYFEKEQALTLEAEGYMYKKDELQEVTISLDETLPKDIIYEGIPLTITTLNYQDGLLEVGILDKNPTKHQLNYIRVNGIPNQKMSMHSYMPEDADELREDEYIVKIKVPAAPTYQLALEYTLQKEEPFTIQLELE